jgi:putative two-component system response regulator
MTALGLNGNDKAADQSIDCLVVDDEPRLRQVLLHLMRGCGYRCFEAANGVEAIELLERQPVALVMSDMRMPRMDGTELLGQIRQRWPDIAVVMITAVADVETAVGALASGAMDYLTKPFHLEEVRARVTKALEKRRLVLENRAYQTQLEQRVAAQARRLEQVFLAGIQALADSLELKDPYTRGHSVRVSRYSAKIARALKLDEETVRQIELGGHLHDIGKIGVREDILNKPAPLTEDEYKHVMTHPVVGWRILSPVLDKEPIALNVVRYHHERVDGGGFPDGLRGEQIPIEARIASVADALDAMMSGRPYRGGEMSLDAALLELYRGRGAQFDGAVVEAAVEAFRREELELTQTPPEGSTLVSMDHV